MDPRFDLSRAYWLVAGIAGVDPDEASLGSAAWAEWVIDGSLMHEIDARDTAGLVERPRPARSCQALPQPVPEGDGVVYRLDPDLVDWAYHLTRKVALDDTEALRALREPYVGHPARSGRPSCSRATTSRP
jgi:purine nucleoside permease